MAGEPLDYWDSSIFLARINGESAHLPAILRVAEQYGTGQRLIVTSALTLAEVAYSTAELSPGPRGRPQFSPSDDQERALAQALSEAAGVRIVPASEEIGHRARALVRLGLSEQRPLQPADAIHLATAEAAEVETIYTLDRQWFVWATTLGIAIETPR